METLLDGLSRKKKKKKKALQTQPRFKPGFHFTFYWRCRDAFLDGILLIIYYVKLYTNYGNNVTHI